MPSAFSVLAESPAARRRRRLARLQAQAEFEEIIARVDAEEQAAGDEADEPDGSGGLQQLGR